jgi:2-isopropylmalate synthase
VKCGFKEIEVGFPSASNTEFDFNRRLIEENRAPADVWLQVLVQAREDLIERTVESSSARSAYSHALPSPAQRAWFWESGRDQGCCARRMIQGFPGSGHGNHARIRPVSA